MILWDISVASLHLGFKCLLHSNFILYFSQQNDEAVVTIGLSTILRATLCHCLTSFNFLASFSLLLLLWRVLSSPLLFLFTLPLVPFGIQRRCLSQGKSHSSACASSGVSCLHPLFRIPLLRGCRGRTCPVGGDTQIQLTNQFMLAVTSLKFQI